MMTIDPVCGMPVDEAVAKGAGLCIEHHGRSYLFCSEKCRQEFAGAPDRYARPGSVIGPDAEHAGGSEPAP